MKIQFRILVPVVLGLSLIGPSFLSIAKEPPSAKEGSLGDGKYDLSFFRKNLTVGKTTDAEARDKFGKPSDVSRKATPDYVRELWTYDQTAEGGRGVFNKFRKATGSLGSLIGGRFGTSTASSVAGSAASGESNSRELGRTVSGENGENDKFSKIVLEFRNGVLYDYDVYQD